MLVRSLAAAASVLLAVLAAGCGDSSDDDAVPATTEAATGDHNDADVEFAQGMIPHHEQAIEMAELALERAESAEVKDLAQRIKDAQGPEIEEMTGWLESWEEPVAPEGGMSGMDHGADSGMMSDTDMEELEAAEGAAFDALFLSGMIEHHEGAVTMAEAELENGEYEPAKELAQKIIDAQEAEIEEMKKLQQAGG